MERENRLALIRERVEQRRKAKIKPPRTYPPQGKKALLLDAARRLQQPSFTLTELVLHAWRLYPEEFGLPGMAHQHPNSHSVVWMLAGRYGLVNRGFLTRVKENVYRVPGEAKTP